MIANEEIDDKRTVGMVDDDKKMEITMIAIKEIWWQAEVDMVDYEWEWQWLLMKKLITIRMEQRWQASVLTVSWVITHEEIGNKRMITVGNDNVKDGWWSLTKKMMTAG